MRIMVLFGTQSGNAELVTDELVDDLRGKGHEVTKASMAKVELSIFEEEAAFLVILSSYGEGELPEKSRSFFDKLESTTPDLSRIRYGIFGLGDKKAHAPTFCFGAMKMDRLLERLGARRVGEVECHDLWDKNYAEEHAIAWAEALDHLRE